MNEIAEKESLHITNTKKVIAKTLMTKDLKTGSLKSEMF